jgi:hypothetical protein
MTVYCNGPYSDSKKHLFSCLRLNNCGLFSNKQNEMVAIKIVMPAFAYYVKEDK